MDQEEKMKRKFFIVSMLTIGLFLGVFGFNDASLAANHNFFFDFSERAYTADKPKYSKSSVYIRSNYMVGGRAFSAYVTLRDRSRIGPSKAVYLNKDVYLTNYAVETYGSGVRVRVQGSSPPDGVRNASGRWRPDL